MPQEQKNQVTVGLIQMSYSQRPEDNLAKTHDRIYQAASRGAQIISLSELFFSRYFCQTNDKKHFALAEPVPGPTTERLSETAKKNGVVLVASLFEKDQERYFNTALVIDADGRFLGKYRKLHIPDDPEHHYSEKFYFTPGNLGVPVFNTRFGKISVLICWDQWYPEAARIAAEKGAQLLFYPTAIGWQLDEKGEDVGRTEFDAWVTIQRSHAIANGIFVASVNRVGLEEKIDFWGGSFVCDPFGRILAQASPDKEEIMIASCDLNRIEEVRSSWPFLTSRRFKTVVSG